MGQYKTKMHLKLKEGAYHKQTGVPSDKKIPQSTIEKDKHSSNPLTKKRAVFADNARHWKH